MTRSICCLCAGLVVGWAVPAARTWEAERRAEIRGVRNELRAEIKQVNNELNGLVGELAKLRPPLSSAVGPEPGLSPVHEAAPPRVTLGGPAR